MRPSFTGLLVLVFSVAMISCGDDGPGRGPCGDFNWRSPTPDQVVCPYTPDCVCSSTDVCCVTVEGQEFQSASCEPLTSCSDLAFECDGPEDCPTGEECCVDVDFGGGSTCVTSGSCIGTLKAVMCRGDDDCAVGECYPGIEDSYFEDVAGYCD